MTERKRPWTENIEASRCSCGHPSCDKYLMSNDTCDGHFTKADAQLFASAPALYEALEQYYEEISLIPEGIVGDPDMKRRIRAALRAANPEAFETPTVPASEPEGDSK